jgi:hypothetical protein
MGEEDSQHIASRRLMEVGREHCGWHSIWHINHSTCIFSAIIGRTIYLNVSIDVLNILISEHCQPESGFCILLSCFWPHWELLGAKHEMDMLALLLFFALTHNQQNRGGGISGKLAFGEPIKVAEETSSTALFAFGYE